ncbi:MAG: hypothetical protein Q9183_002852 [Haloplaca sp. 2 TL-2023]
MAQVQVTIAWPFMPKNLVGYISRAFQFSRQFLYRWTVNWRFLDEETFLSPEFAFTLIAANLAVLSLFFATRWLRPPQRTIQEFISSIWEPSPLLMQKEIVLQITPSYIMTILLSSMAIGLLFARSLHYQFYAYIAWSSPFLLWKAGLHPLAMYGVWAAQEWAWNVYPSTSASSIVVVGCLFLQVFGVWWGTRTDSPTEEISVDEKGRTHAHVD